MKIKVFSSLILLTLCFYLMGLHLGTVVPYDISDEDLSGQASEKIELEHEHLLLHGSSYKRGLEFGKLTKDRLLDQELLMTGYLNKFIPSKLGQELLFFGSMLWFQGLDTFIEKESLLEMQGVAKSTHPRFDSYGAPLTRQLAYHGIHEVGQMFVDSDRGDMGCFSAIVKDKNDSFVIGRNFDFDIDSFFRKNFYLKWSFPNDDSISYVSVIWAGMVGVVTGVNAKGVYVAINAAGSEDFARVGTPTTLIIKNVLAKASTLDEAIEIIKEKKSFITEVFVVGSHQGVAVVEKTPKRSNVRYIKSNSIVSNHLLAKVFNDDTVNKYRKSELTTKHRYDRGVEILNNSKLKGVDLAISVLRDKKLFKGSRKQLGHRGAIDSLIASHSTIYDEAKNVFFVNSGPGAQGKFIGYDLVKSFKNKRPVVVSEYPKDNDITLSRYWDIVNTLEEVSSYKKLSLPENCDLLDKKLESVLKFNISHHDIMELHGNFLFSCKGNLNAAKELWQSALNEKPPFKPVVDRLKGKLNEK
ncbi:hypothetical protein A9Q84_01205 [Halobacteriovorax marinus]|uniref:Peptidase C45 hydrolase domain-containing protein n=1 Tax=Halobacteriovorax marinus TaxID=97084 RepID=A0A1Y5FCB9_9BACT|nr:hypothetical protein A9Q84_01205 [Halobacteriovorax marinus]